MLTPVTDSVLDITKAAKARNAPLDEPLYWSRTVIPIRPDHTAEMSMMDTIDRVHGSAEDALAWVNGGPDDELRVLVALSLLGIWRVACSHPTVWDGPDRVVGNKTTATFTPCPFGPDDADDDNPLRMPRTNARQGD